MILPDFESVIAAIMAEVCGELGDDLYTQLLKAELLPPDTRHLFPRLALLVGEAASSNTGLTPVNREALLTFAAASQFMTCASGIWDDIVDQDKETSLAFRQGTDRALLAALGMWFILERQLLHIAEKLANETGSPGYPWLIELHTTLLRAARGQFLEVAFSKIEQNSIVERCLELIALKAGLFLEILFKLSALLAGAQEAVALGYGRVGHYLGVLHQLRNDLISCYDPNPLRNSFCQKKITLPLAYAITSPLAIEVKTLWQAVEPCQTNIPKFLVLLEQSGGIGTTVLTMHQLYQQMAEQLSGGNQADRQILEIAAKLLTWPNMSEVKGEGG